MSLKRRFERSLQDREIAVVRGSTCARCVQIDNRIWRYGDETYGVIVLLFRGRRRTPCWMGSLFFLFCRPQTHKICILMNVWPKRCSPPAGTEQLHGRSQLTWKPLHLKARRHIVAIISGGALILQTWPRRETHEHTWGWLRSGEHAYNTHTRAHTRRPV